MNPRAFIEFFGTQRASAILRTPDPAAGRPAMDAALNAGFRVCEFTLTIPNAIELISLYAARNDIVVGAGTVLTPDDARAAVDAGARFLVSPVVDEAVIEAAHDLGVAVMPGTHTPTEMLRAHRAGAQLQKLFPAPGIGPMFIRATLGPMPFLRIVPTSGIDASNVADYLAAGAFAAGFVAPLFDAEEISAGRFDLIEQRGRMLLAASGAPTPEPSAE